MPAESLVTGWSKGSPPRIRHKARLPCRCGRDASRPTRGFGDPCLPTHAPVAPSGPMWVHEIKHDGYRLMIRRTPDGVRIRTRRGYDWTDRFPVIVEATSAAAMRIVDGN
jgi:ATP-dependent DNA ligase